MLTSIKIKDVASYDNTTGAELNELKKINFVYGTNGSGKTTISNFLADTDREGFSSCTATWEHNTPLATLVYNKEFRDENFGSGKIAGVFTLGKATKEEIEEIEKKKQELTELETLVKTQLKTKEKQEGKSDEVYKAFVEDRWKNCFKKYPGYFKEAFQGAIGSKIAFAEKLISICKSDFDSTTLPTLEELKQKANTVFGETPEHQQLIKIPNYTGIEELEEDVIWSTVIVGKNDVDIAELITKLGSNDWVDKGRTFLQNNNTCPFCQQQTISDSFREQLEQYFDESFKLKKNELSTKKSLYKSSFAQVFESLSIIENQEKENPNSKLGITAFSNHLKTLRSQYAENVEHIKNKSDNSSHKVELTSTQNAWSAIKECIGNANEAIKEQNRIVNNLKDEQQKLKATVWKFVAKASQSSYEDYNKESNGLSRGIKFLLDQISTKNTESRNLDQEIKNLTKNLTSVEPAVIEINRLLNKFGFHNFKLIPSPEIKNYYTIQREDGSLAHSTLSEGEITFITFLYFLQLVKGGLSEATVNDDRVVVIDDPISSLDSNVLFIVSTLIKGLIKDIKENEGRTKQLILLTHNIYFHKEVSFIDGRTRLDNQTSFWINRKVNKVSTIQAYGMENPIESSYELLWREIKNWESNSGITVQNTMRRIIENYRFGNVQRTVSAVVIPKLKLSEV